MTTTFAAIAAASYLAYFAFLTLAHVQGRHYSVIRNAVSDYAVGPTSRWFTGMGISTAIGGAALIPVYWAHEGFSRRVYIVILLAVLTAGRLVLLLFKTDVVGEKKTRTGWIHLIIAIVNFTLVYIVIDTTTSRLAELGVAGGPGSLLLVLRWVTTIGLIGVVATMVLGPVKRFFGLAERMFLLGGSAWLLAFALIVLAR